MGYTDLAWQPTNKEKREFVEAFLKTMRPYSKEEIKAQAKKKAEYGKRCRSWVSRIHKLSEVKSDN